MLVIYKVSSKSSFSKEILLIILIFQVSLIILTPEQRRKYPENLRKNYKYEAASRVKLNIKTPIAAEKNRNDCATIGTIEYLLNNTYYDEIC